MVWLIEKELGSAIKQVFKEKYKEIFAIVVFGLFAFWIIYILNG